MILSLRQLIEKQIEFNNDTFIEFIDLEKAFDTLPWKELFTTLEEIGIDYRDKRVVYNIYIEKPAIIQVFDKSAAAKIENGASKTRKSTVAKIIQYLSRPIYQWN